MKAGLLFMINKNFNNRFTAMFLVMVSLVIIATVAKAQPNFPFVQRNTWDGPYDIRMIAAPNHEAVYVDPAAVGSSAPYKLKEDSVIRYETQLMSGGTMNINNDFKGGSPFKVVDVPVPSLACPDPNTPCFQGLVTASGTCSAGGTKYESAPASVSKTIAMTYTDYDNDNSTYASSMAKLDISACSEIEAAYLYWTGNFRGSAPNYTLSTPVAPPHGSYTGAANVFDISNDASIRTVLLKRPGGIYQTITANAVVPTAGVNNTGTRAHSRGYLCVANVTALLQGTGGGEFWVGNIRSYPQEADGGSTSGWVLVVISKSPLSPPRRISLWDGFIAVNESDGDDPLTLNLTGLLAPSTVTGFQSYIGFAALDGENIADELIGKGSPEGLGFQTNGGPLVTINPLCDEQPKYRLWHDDGIPSDASGTKLQDACKAPNFAGAWANVCDGISSSHITSYSETTKKNGEEIVRLPSNPNTLGIDAHHIKLKSGDIAASANSATLTVRSGPQGGTSPFLAYVAIERLQPKLEMTKTSDVDATGTNSVITYTLKVKNKGNDVSLGGDIIRDTLDLATTYIAGSLTTIPAGSANVVAGFPVTLGDGTQAVNFNVSKKINAGDSISIVFKVQVKDYASNKNLWDVQCKRTITNTAWIYYNTLSSGILVSKSNANDCGIGSETRVLIQDPLFGGTTTAKKLGPFNACPYIMESVLDHVRAELKTAGVPTADILLYDIRNSKYDRVQPADTFGAALNVSFFAIKDNNTTGNCQDIYEVQYKTCTLPLDMISFTGQWTLGGARLNWVVARASEGDYFIVERSGNGHQFFSVGRVNAKGSNTYSFIDSELGSGATYYRLVYVAANGNKKYTNAITLENTSNTDLSIYPNPFAGTANLIVQNDAELPYDLRIMDITGKLVHSSTGHMANETVVIGKELTAGIYLVEIVFESYKLNSRFVKMN